MIVKLQENVVDCKRRVNSMRDGENKEEDNEVQWPVMKFLNPRKACPRINRLALWMLLDRYGIERNYLETNVHLHEATKYKVRGKVYASES